MALPATFAELSGKTKLTLQAEVWKSTPIVSAVLAGMEEGWIAFPSTWDK